MSIESPTDKLRAKVTAHSAEVHQFEQDLLQPIDTRVAVFLTLASRNDLDVDAVELSIDEQPVSAHLYSPREREALERGGVQQLFTGNLTNGKHVLKVVFSVRTAKDQFVRREATHHFYKKTGTYRVQLVLEARAPDYEPSVNVLEWQ
ncbi:AraC family transcriptional regulator [Marinobacter salinexigens]|uniref:AraC family transcriptional regulator n=2 Tax=Marinobacter salinexigens TaxID=2919747 RepID=A0A5B0VLI5_9GAMM|nr:AraC family transcriptional regulator [Marinobacter salinexigens]